MESILEQPSTSLGITQQLDSKSLHLVPCGIQHDGKANIPNYFFLVNDNTQLKNPIQESSTLDSNTSNNDTTTTSNISKIPPPEVSLRGRSLKGTTITVPQGYMGTIYKPYEPLRDNNSNNKSNHSDSLNKTADEEDDDEEDDQEYQEMLKNMQEERKHLATQAQFKEFTIWGHDEQPDLRTDKFMRAMQWIDIADVLHKPLC